MLIATISTSALVLLCGSAAQNRALIARTYYIAVRADVSDPHTIHVRGASNLPAGSVLDVAVYDCKYTLVGEKVHATVDSSGFFAASIPTSVALPDPLPDLIADVFFAPWKQPRNVTDIIGRKGERLGGLGKPQVSQYSGENFALVAIAKVAD